MVAASREVSAERVADNFSLQMRDGHLFLADKFVERYSIDTRNLGWRHDFDLCGWVSPYINPWKVIHRMEDIRIDVAASYPAEGG